MYPIPPSKPLPYLPQEIQEQIIASFPDPFSERDEYSSIAQAAPDLMLSIRRHRFRRITILASACYQKENRKALRLVDILGDFRDTAMVVRHVEIDYQLQNHTSGDNMDIYPPPSLGKLFRVCSNMTSASIHNFDSSHFCHPTMDTSTVFAKQTFLVPIVELTNTSLTNLELVNFRGKLSDLCKFIRAFGPDPVVHINLRKSKLVELGSSNCLCLKNVKSFQFDGNTTSSDDALLHLLGSKHTIFPNLEQVRYRLYEPLDRLSRVLQQAQGSLRVLELNCGLLKRGCHYSVSRAIH